MLERTYNHESLLRSFTISAYPQQLINLSLFLGSSDMLNFYKPIIEKQMEEMNAGEFKRCFSPHLFYLHPDASFCLNTRIEPLLHCCPQRSRVNGLPDSDEDKLEDLLYLSVLSVHHSNFARILHYCRPKINPIDCELAGLCEWTSTRDIGGYTHTIHQVQIGQSFVEAHTTDFLLVSDNASEDWEGLELVCESIYLYDPSKTHTIVFGLDNRGSSRV
ncbi:hypothetical protein BDA99DRAFT_563922 [Phascolomyces articulosus]|uniref:Uncharacterized protein n=1 Tax=Phascolomyces articulosus TaxID=60185 RepID=A0AAD5JRI1_9FUNG|nr:hypothetical protein BDA99DRAFT_563922 [Phascolomyces articulosus]